MLDKLLKPLVPYLPESNRLERIWILAKFDFKSRYYYHTLGILWAFIKPVFEFLVYYMVFSVIFESNVPHFALYLFLGLIVWYFFMEGTSKGIHILLSKRYLIENIPFNRLDLFISTTVSAFFAFFFNFVVYLLLSIIREVPPFLHSNLIYFPVLVANLFLLIIGISLILSVISIYFKDIQHLWDVILMIGLWLSPILYSKELLEENLPKLIYLNPVAGILVNVREIILYSRAPDYHLLLVSFLYSLVIFFIGLLAFNKLSHKAAEKI